MLVNNYWLLRAEADSGADINVGTNSSIDIGLKKLNGNTCTYVNALSASYVIHLINNIELRKNLDVIIGTGTTEPTEEGYCLESPCGSGVTYTSSIITDSDGYSCKTVITIAITNNSGSDITISEIGVTKGIQPTTSGLGEYVPVLILREVLSESVTIPNGLTKMVTFEWIEH